MTTPGLATAGPPSAARRYHLGIDWGTSATKLILRDMAQGEHGDAAFVLRWGVPPNAERYPSSVSVMRGVLHFGLGAEQCGGIRLPSVKPLVGTRRGATPMPGVEPLSAEDIGTLYLAHVIQRALGEARMLASHAHAAPRLGITLGIPDVDADRDRRRTRYASMVTVANAIVRQEGVDLARIRIQDAARLLATHAARGAGADHEQLTRAESAAAVYWAFRAPEFDEGLYTCIDVGAWTTNVSYFRIHHEGANSTFRKKAKLSFYSFACAPPGAKELGFGDTVNSCATEMRAMSTERRDQVLQSMHGVWAGAYQQAWRKEQSLKVWREQLRSIHVGGGTRVESVQRTFRRPPGRSIPAPPQAPRVRCPLDLHVPSPGTHRAERRYTDDAHFLYVAYGLSVPHAQFPSITLASDVSEFRPQGPRVWDWTSEDLGYGD